MEKFLDLSRSRELPRQRLPRQRLPRQDLFVQAIPEVRRIHQVEQPQGEINNPLEGRRAAWQSHWEAIARKEVEKYLPKKKKGKQDRQEDRREGEGRQKEEERLPPLAEGLLSLMRMKASGAISAPKQEPVKSAAALYGLTGKPALLSSDQIQSPVSSEVDTTRGEMGSPVGGVICGIVGGVMGVLGGGK